MGAAGYMLGTFIAARIVMRLGIDRTMGIGCVILAAGGLIMAAVVALHLANVIWFVGSMMIYLAGLGLALPAAMAGALTPFHDRAGTASSLMGFTQQSGAAIAAGGIGLYLGQSAWPVASMVASMGCVALLIWMTTRKVRAADRLNPAQFLFTAHAVKIFRNRRELSHCQAVTTIVLNRIRGNPLHAGNFFAEGCGR